MPDLHGPVGAALLALLLAGRALGQDTVLVRDEWTATWRDGRKAGWERLQLERHEKVGPGEAAYVISRTWTRLVDDERARTTLQVMTDRDGQLLRLCEVEVAPWGTTTTDVAPIGTSLHWRRRVRDLPPEEHDVARPIFEPMIVAQRRLEAGVGSIATTVLALRSRQGGPRVEEVRVEAERDPTGGARTVIDGVTTRWDHQGLQPSRLAPGRWSVPTTSARAPDLAEPLPAAVAGESSPPPPETPGLQVRLPGPGWLRSDSKLEPGELAHVNVVHPSWVWAAAVVSEGRLGGSTAKERLTFARAVAAKFGAFAAGEPVARTWRGRSGFSFPVRLPLGGVELEGDLFLVELGVGRATVWAVQPADLRASRPEDVSRALEAFQLVDLQRSWRRVEFGALSAEVPAGWAGGDRWTWNGASGSTLMLCRDRLAGRTLGELLSLSPGDPRVERVEERRDVGQVDGRDALTVILRQSASMPDGFVVVVRTALCATERADGLYEAVILRASELELSREEVDRMLGSIRWSR